MKDVAHIKEQLGVYARVHVIEGKYHRYLTNLTEPDRNGRVHVIGGRMRCGIDQLHPTPWSWPTLAVSVEVAHATSEPCDRCFSLTPTADIAAQLELAL